MRPTVRLLPWWHIGIGCLLAAGLVWSIRGDAYLSLDGSTHMLRVAMVGVALSVAFLLDDPTEDDLAGSGLPIAGRRTVRLALTLPAVAAIWIGLLGLAASAPALTLPDAEPSAGFLLPVWALSLEFGALVAVTLAAAVVAMRRAADRAGGLVAGPAMLGILGVALLLPEGWRLFVPHAAAPVDGEVAPMWDAWVSSHQRWAAVGAAALLVLVWASRDPARRRLRVVLGVSRRASGPTDVSSDLSSQPLQRV